jgi:hypothetical protein
MIEEINVSSKLRMRSSFPLWRNQFPGTNFLVCVRAISTQDIGAVEGVLGFERIVAGKGLGMNEKACKNLQRAGKQLEVGDDLRLLV